jgi:probable HAF family extracellular repeat protein
LSRCALAFGCGVVLACLIIEPASASAISFEDLPDAYFFNVGDQNIGTFYPGLTFGPDVTALSASRFGAYDDLAFPAHSGDVVVWDASDPAVTVTFTVPVSQFGVWYSSVDPLNVEAFGTRNEVVDISELKANSDGVTGSSSFFSLSTPGVQTVQIKGNAGLFVLDDVSFTAVPEPRRFGVLVTLFGLLCIAFRCRSTFAHAFWRVIKRNGLLLLFTVFGYALNTQPAVAQSFTCDPTQQPSPPPAPKITVFNMGNSVVGGADVNAYIGLDQPIPPFCRLDIKVITHNPVIHVPAIQSFNFLAGGFSQWMTDTVGALTSVQVDLYDTYSSYNQPSISAHVLIRPVGTPPPPPNPPPTVPQLEGITVNPVVIVAGRQAKITVILTSPAPSSGSSVSLTSDDSAAVTVPGNVVVPAGESQLTATVVTTPVSQDTAVTITASFLGLDRAASLKLLAISAVPTYDVIDLGTLGGSTSRAFALTEAGDVVGGAQTAAGSEHGFLWSSGPGMTDLGVLPGKSSSRALAANYVTVNNPPGSLLIVTGESDVTDSTVSNQSYVQPFLWYDGSIYGEIDNPTDPGSARGISSKGSLLISSTDRIFGGTLEYSAWIHSPFDAGTTGCHLAGFCPLTYLYAPSGGHPYAITEITASAISPQGRVAGTVHTSAGDRAAYWDATNVGINLPGLGGISSVDIGVLPDGSDGHGYGASDAGDVVGSSSLPWGEHAFRWVAGSIADLKTLPDATDSAANAVNLYGFVVGRSGGKAIIWDQFDNIIDLNERIPPASGWTLTEAHAINNAGQVAGEGIHDGKTRAFLLLPQPPPPCGSDITNEVAVARGGFRVNPSNGHFTQSLTVTNIGSSAIAGPIAVTLDGLSSYASLANASGSTTCATPAGSPYLLLNLGTAAALAPNASVSALLDFINPPKQGIEYSVRVLAGNRY